MKQSALGVMLSYVLITALGCASARAPMVVRPTAAMRHVDDFSAAESSGMQLTVGEEREGRLTAQDYIWDTDDTHFQIWELVLGDQREVTVDLASEDFDSFLWIQGPGVDLSDDDGAGYCNSRISFSPRRDRQYIVVVNTVGVATGEFVLTADEQPAPRDPRNCAPGHGGDFEAAACEILLDDLPTNGREVVQSETAHGTLGGDDATCPDGSYIQAWHITGESGEIRIIDLTSRDFDTFLYVSGPGLEEVLTDDDDGGACNSRVRVRFPRSGTYTIGVSSFSATAGGDFEITVSERTPPLDSGACPSSGAGGPDSFIQGTGTALNGFSVALLPTEDRVIEPGEQIDGEITEDDALLSNNAYAQAWRLPATAGQTLRVRLISEDQSIDPYLGLAGPGLDDVLKNDDGDGSLNSRIVFTVPETGDYKIVASTFAPSTTGPFYLAVELED